MSRCNTLSAVLFSLSLSLSLLPAHTYTTLLLPLDGTYAVVVVVHTDATDASGLLCCQRCQYLFIRMVTLVAAALKGGGVPVSLDAPVQ